MTEDLDRNGTPGQSGPRAGLRRWVWVLAPAALVVGAFLAAPAVVQGAGGPGGFWRHRHGDGPHGDPRAHLARVADTMLTVVDANEAQRGQILALLDRTATTIAPLADQHRDNREAWVAALAGPTVDRAALEALRQDEMALAAEFTAAIIPALADASEVLTPEQRAKLASLARRFHGEER